MEKLTKNIIIGVSVFLLILGVAYFQTSQSFIGVGGIPVQYQEFNLNNIEGTAESPYFGSISSNTIAMQEYIDLGMNPYAKHSICGSNDGDVSISNSIAGGETLILSTSMSVSKRTCSASNYVKTKLTFPAGELTAVCSANSKETNDGASFASCKVGNTFNVASVYHNDCNRGQKNLNVNFWAGNCKPSIYETKTIIFNEPTEVEILVTSAVGNAGNSNAKLTLNFVETEVECLTDSNCPEDTKVNEICKDNQLNTNYLENYCENNKCIKKSKTIISEKETGICGIECLTDSECSKEIINYQEEINKIIYFNAISQKCQNNICVNITKTLKTEEITEEINDTKIPEIHEVENTNKIKIFFESIIKWFRNLF